MLSLDAIALVFTVVAATVGAAYTISRKLGGIEEKVNSLDKKISEMSTGLRADMKALEERLRADIMELEERLKADITGVKADVKRLEDRTYEMSKLLGSIEAEISSLIKK